MKQILEDIKSLLKNNLNSKNNHNFSFAFFNTDPTSKFIIILIFFFIIYFNKSIFYS